MAHAKKMVRKNKVRIMSDANQRVIERNDRISKEKAIMKARMAALREKFLAEYREKMASQRGDV